MFFLLSFICSSIPFYDLPWFGVVLILGGFSFLRFSQLHALLDGLAAAQALTIPICTFSLSPFVSLICS